YKSSDGGTRWTPLVAPHRWSRPYALAVDPKHPRTVYVGTGNAVEKTTDGDARGTPTAAGFCRLRGSTGARAGSTGLPSTRRTPRSSTSTTMPTLSARAETAGTRGRSWRTATTRAPLTR